MRRIYVFVLLFIIHYSLFTNSVSAQTVTFQIGNPASSVTYGAFQGFGAEWDPFFWNTNNQNRGLTQADWDLITGRIHDLQPGIIRVMMQLYWATNDPNLGSWTWNTPQMQSVFKYLDFLKANNIDVVLTDWGWAVRSNTNFYSNPTDTRFAQGVAAYMNEFINNRGYTNIKYLVIGNEPDNEIQKDYGQAAYDTMYRNVHAAIDANGIGSKVKLTGPDMGGTWDFMKTSVSDLKDILDTYDFHRYASFDETSNTNLPGTWESLWSHLDLWRTETLSRDTNATSKLVLVTEMGNSGGGTNTHPLIDTYDYALHMADYGTTLLTTRVNAGIAWCMHDMYYFDGGQFMQWGMWKYKNNNWALRPWAQTFGLLMKYAPRGSLVASINSSPPQTPALTPYRAAVLKRPDGGYSVFLVNRTTVATQFNLQFTTTPTHPLSIYSVDSGTFTANPNLLLVPANGSVNPAASLSISLPANSFKVLVETTGTPPKPGDYDLDGDVDFVDLKIYLNQFTTIFTFNQIIRNFGL